MIISRTLVAIAFSVALIFATASVSASERFEVVGGGATFIDNRTSLEWSRCRYGDNWDGDDDCDLNYGENQFSHDDVAGKELSYGPYDDWRIPTLEEMKTLIFCEAEDNKTNFKESDLSLEANTYNSGFVVGYDRADCGTYHQNAMGNLIPSRTRTSELATSTLDEKIETHMSGSIDTAWFVIINQGHFSRKALSPASIYGFLLVRNP